MIGSATVSTSRAVESMHCDSAYQSRGGKGWCISLLLFQSCHQAVIGMSIACERLQRLSSCLRDKKPRNQRGRRRPRHENTWPPLRKSFFAVQGQAHTATRVPMEARSTNMVLRNPVGEGSGGCGATRALSLRIITLRVHLRFDWQSRSARHRLVLHLKGRDVGFWTNKTQDDCLPHT